MNKANVAPFVVGNCIAQLEVSREEFDELLDRVRGKKKPRKKKSKKKV